MIIVSKCNSIVDILATHKICTKATSEVPGEIPHNVALIRVCSV